jgi:hypothetical protein
MGRPTLGTYPVSSLALRRHRSGELREATLTHAAIKTRDRRMAIERAPPQRLSVVRRAELRQLFLFLS